MPLQDVPQVLALFLYAAPLTPWSSGCQNPRLQAVPHLYLMRAPLCDALKPLNRSSDTYWALDTPPLVMQNLRVAKTAGARRRVGERRDERATAAATEQVL